MLVYRYVTIPSFGSNVNRTEQGSTAQDGGDRVLPSPNRGTD